MTHLDFVVYAGAAVGAVEVVCMAGVVWAFVESQATYRDYQRCGPHRYSSGCTRIWHIRRHNIPGRKDQQTVTTLINRKRQMAVQHGPNIGEHHGKPIPAYIIEDGLRYDYHRVAIETDGGVELSQLARNEVVIAPGLIYRLS